MFTLGRFWRTELKWGPSPRGPKGTHGVPKGARETQRMVTGAERGPKGVWLGLFWLSPCGAKGRLVGLGGFWGSQIRLEELTLQLGGFAASPQKGFGALGLWGSPNVFLIAFGAFPFFSNVGAWGPASVFPIDLGEPVALFPMFGVRGKRCLLGFGGTL